MRTTALLAAVLLTASRSSAGSLRLPAVFGDGAVLQQGLPLPVWGWAAPGSRVTVRLKGQVRKTTAGENGETIGLIRSVAYRVAEA